MSEAARERVLKICGSAVAERRAEKWLGGGYEYVVLDRPYGQVLANGKSELAAWESAEKHILQSRYYRDDQGNAMRTDADQTHPGGSYREITAADYYRGW